MTQINEIWFLMTESQKFQFIESNIQITTPKGNLIPLKLASFQRRWMLDGPLFSDFSKKTTFNNRICLKCRNIGASYVMIGVEAALSAWIYPNIFIPFVASKEDQASDLISHCKSVVEHAKFAIPLKIALKNQPMGELRLANGSKIKAFQANNPGGIRGPRALIVYCLPYSQLIVTDVGLVSIGDVVTKGVGSYALSFDGSSVVWKRIINRVENDLGSRRLLKLFTDDGGSFVCTEDHKISTVDGYLPAIDCLNRKIYKFENSHNIYNGKSRPSKLNFSGKGNNNRNCTRGRWNNEIERKEEKLGSIFYHTREKPRLYELENERINPIPTDNETRDVWLHWKKKYFTNEHESISFFYKNRKGSVGKKLQQSEKRIEYNFNEIFNPNGISDFLHGRWICEQQKQFNIINPRFYIRNKQNNTEIFDEEISDYNHVGRRQEGERTLSYNFSGWSETINGNDRTLHSSDVQIQNDSEIFMPMLQERILSWKNAKALLRQNMCRKNEYNENEDTSIRQNKISMSSMRKGNTHIKIENTKINSKKKNLLTTMCTRVEEVAQKRLSEKVYNIEVEDTHLMFISNGKNVILSPQCDEFAFVSRPQEVLSAVQYFTAEGGQTNILSTPWGRQNLYWKIWADRRNYFSWKRHYVHLFSNMEQFNVSKQIPEQIANGLKINVPWLSIDFVEKKRKEDAGYNYANFMQEMCGTPIDEVTAVIPEGLLDTNKMEYYFVEKRPLLADGSLDLNPIYVISADFGAERNMTALVTFEGKDGRLVVCNTMMMKGNVSDQIRQITEYVRSFGPRIFIGDSTGLGGISFMDQLKEVLNVGVILGVSYAKKDFAAKAGIDMNNKEYMVNKAVNLLSQGSLIVPHNFHALRDEILGLQKFVYENSIKYSGKSGPVGHDDAAMAWLHAALVYDQIYSMDDGDYILGVANNLTTWHKKKGRMDKPVASAKYEATSIAAMKVHNTRRMMDKYRGFEKLI